MLPLAVSLLVIRSSPPRALRQIECEYTLSKPLIVAPAIGPRQKPLGIRGQAAVGATDALKLQK